MLDMIECIWNKRIKVTLNFEFVALYNTIFVQIMRGYFNGCMIE